jgi:transcriptional regulator with XRE-family HTH domain
MSSNTDIRPRRRSHATAGNDVTLLELGDGVRAARVAAGMTQQELALVAGVGRDLVIQLENGKPGVSLSKASAVLAALGLRLAAVAR